MKIQIEDKGFLNKTKRKDILNLNNDFINLFFRLENQ